MSSTEDKAPTKYDQCMNNERLALAKQEDLISELTTQLENGYIIKKNRTGECAEYFSSGSCFKYVYETDYIPIDFGEWRKRLSKAKHAYKKLKQTAVEKSKVCYDKYVPKKQPDLYDKEYEKFGILSQEQQDFFDLAESAHKKADKKTKDKYIDLMAKKIAEMTSVVKELKRLDSEKFSRDEVFLNDVLATSNLLLKVLKSMEMK